MNFEEAITLRDIKRQELIGKPIHGEPANGWDIKDVIVANRENVGFVYEAMWQKQISNEVALSLIEKHDDFNVFVISHQWPWGSGNLLTQSIESYYRTTNP
jgi:hypothetical protein